VVSEQIGKRPYNSARRQEQARATRLAILHSAKRLFEADGYSATTMDAIALDAGVALKTVYSAFGTKAGLLRALWDLLLKGDTGEAPVAQRAAYLEIMQEPDPRRQLELNARNGRIVKTRIGAMFGVIRGAATTDPDAAALWELIQSDFHANQRTIVDSLDAKHSLRHGLDVDTATDILWTLNHPDLYLLLVGRRGWPAEQFEEWLADSFCHHLLGTT
jgi:AcrR family transcriptional regulator